MSGHRELCSCTYELGKENGEACLLTNIDR
jgi:hypothetical protein